MLHELPDQLNTLRTLTKWAARINHPAEAPAMVAEAFRQLTNELRVFLEEELPPWWICKHLASRFTESNRWVDR